jgi:hypothetical protein
LNLHFCFFSAWGGESMDLRLPLFLRLLLLLSLNTKKPRVPHPCGFFPPQGWDRKTLNQPAFPYPPFADHSPQKAHNEYMNSPSKSFHPARAALLFPISYTLFSTYPSPPFPVKL